jgi:chromatin assembly factor 1 subunit B
MSSSDGFCSALSFASGELGKTYSGSVPNYHHPSLVTSVPSSAQNTPNPTPTLANIPSSQVKVPGAPPMLSPTLLPPARPASPARSVSSTSTATISNLPPPPFIPGTVVNNPTPTLGNVPSVAATNSGAVNGIPMTTPPETPLGGGTRSSASSVSSHIGKRDYHTHEGGMISESDKEDAAPERAPKKRRIAPTPVTDASGDPSKAS